jgi:lipopolysaccharide export system permease protein
LNPDQLSIKGLSDHIKYLKLQGLDSKKYELAFWEKCFHPFIIISLVLIAVSFVFGPLRSTTMGYRIFIGVVVGIIFQFTQKLLGPSSLIYGFSPLYAVLFPIVIFLFIGLFVLSKIR